MTTSASQGYYLCHVNETCLFNRFYKFLYVYLLLSFLWRQNIRDVWIYPSVIVVCSLLQLLLLLHVYKILRRQWSPFDDCELSNN